MKNNKAVINVNNEIQELREVLVHRPGNELLNLTPDSLEELLFDDIPYLEKAKIEHDQFTDIMRKEGVKVTYLEELMAETFAENPGLRDKFLSEYLDDAEIYSLPLRDRINDFMSQYTSDYDFVMKSMAGIKSNELVRKGKKSLADYVERPSNMIVNPMPNLYFARDPFASVGNNVLINRMYSDTRNRETIYADYIFRYHPKYKGKVNDLYGRRQDFHMEGGDLLNMGHDKLLIGISLRTEADAVEQLAKELFFKQEEHTIKEIFALRIPIARTFMHLDTVFTQIDEDAFTYHPGIRGTLQVFKLSPGDNEDIIIKEKEGKLDEILAQILEIDKVRIFECGAGDPIAAAREQWTDGANTLTIRPGTIIVYKRNLVTNDMLDKAGFNLLEIDADNLSMGRGGPRCMSMPLWRD